MTPEELVAKIERAQRWHDTDHGGEEPGCWCCCDECRPATNRGRPNPFYPSATLAALLVHEEAEAGEHYS